MHPGRLRTLILALVVAGAVIAALFSVRALRALREFREHPPPPDVLEVATPLGRDVELIRDWMTIPFIAKMYHVPPPVLYEALEISPRGNRDKSLIQLNDEYFPGTPGFVEAKIKEAVRENLAP